MASAASDASKRANTTRVIATHDGAFHCDEALGCYMLQRTAAYAGATITRSRDADAWAAADVVIDVGVVSSSSNSVHALDARR